MIKIKIFILIGFYSLSQAKQPNRFMPNLPLGEYRLVLDKIYPCSDSTKNHSINLNYKFNKKTSSTTELKGNLTFLIPFSDNITLDANFSSWGSTGGWVPNTYIINSKNACTNAKKLLGNSWFAFMEGFNIPSNNCPLPVGNYISSGIDLKKFDDNNFPKVYFYGKYKVLFLLKNVDDKVIGCAVVEFTLIRPWETPI